MVEEPTSATLCWVTELVAYFVRFVEGPGNEIHEVRGQGLGYITRFQVGVHGTDGHVPFEHRMEARCGTSEQICQSQSPHATDTHRHDVGLSCYRERIKQYYV